MCRQGPQAYLQARSVGADALDDLLEGSQQEAALPRLRGAPQAGRQHVLRVDGHAAVLAHRFRELVNRQLGSAQQLLFKGSKFSFYNPKTLNHIRLLRIIRKNSLCCAHPSAVLPTQ